MIFHVDQPVVLLGMALGFVVAVLVHNLAQTVAARVIRDPVARMSRKSLIEPKREFEPFGIVAMAVGGLGWGKPVALAEPRNRGASKGRYITALLMGPLAAVAVGLLLVAAFAALSTAASITAPTGERVSTGVPAGYTMLGISGVICTAIGLLYLIPLPPLDGARIMWALAPPTAGWQKARYNLEEQNYGLGALVVLSLPLFGGAGLIVRMVYAMAQPLIDAVTDAVSGL